MESLQSDIDEMTAAIAKLGNEVKLEVGKGRQGKRCEVLKWCFSSESHNKLKQISYPFQVNLTSISSESHILFSLLCILLLILTMPIFHDLSLSTISN